jgi:N-hydroxyarylamine O-acetyltransferase
VTEGDGFDRDAYLARIGYEGALTPTVGVLAALSLAHLRAVPFENLEIVPLGRPVRLEPEALVAKIVRRRRGGFCYELNGLFARLLDEVGFGVEMLAFQFPAEGGGYGPEFDHLCLRVTTAAADERGPAGSRWLADVGAGRTSFASPVPLDPLGGESGPDPDDGAVYRVSAADEYLHVWRREPGEDWSEAYRFRPVARTLADFAEMCRYHQTSPDSPFTQGSVCSRLTLDGRITVRDGRLIVTRAGAKVESALPDDASHRAALLDHFGIDLDRERADDGVLRTKGAAA